MTPAVDVLAGSDGSPEARAALDAALTLLGARVGRVTLAGVLDYDAAAGRTTESEKRLGRELRAAAGRVRAATGYTHVVDTVVLYGSPAEALTEYAAERGYDVIVVGRRGRGLAKSLLGSAAQQLAARSKVPVIIDGQG